MTLQEAYVLQDERKANLAYRKKIQRIKNTILGALLGTGLGAGAVFAKNVSDQMSDAGFFSPLFRKDRNTALAPTAGAAAGALLGGLGGYGLTRLKENYDESAGLDPTLLNMNVRLQS